jgi:serine/threonine-protein kinase
MQATSRPALKAGDVLDGKYVLRDCIGEGGMGSVFLADQPALDRTVAIKVLHPELVGSPSHAQRLRDEATTACRVRDPHCVAVLDASELPDGTPYIVMEHVRGRSLARLLAEEPVSLARAVDLLEQILAALGAIHDSGVIHADVKSDNFLVETVDGCDRVTLIDFGLARLAAAPSEVDLEGGDVMVSGTPEYMAPEVARGEAPICASDLYGAGVILYELLTGVTPFGGGTARQIMVRHAYDPVVAPSLRRPDRDISPALDRVVVRALDKRPTARFADAAAFGRELRAAAGSLWVSAVQLPREHRAPVELPPGHHGAPLPTRFARGSDCGSSAPRAERQELRLAIDEALACGKVTQLANRYIELASPAADDRQWLAVAVERPERLAG